MCQCLYISEELVNGKITTFYHLLSTFHMYAKSGVPKVVIKILAWSCLIIRSPDISGGNQITVLAK